MMKRVLTALLVAAMVLSVCGTALAGLPDGVPTLKTNMNLTKYSDDVADLITSTIEEIQMLLGPDGFAFLNADPDGKYGEATRKAVIAFQKKNKLTVDGRVGDATYDALYAVDSKGKNDPDFVVLKKGMSGSDVYDIKQKLILWHYLADTNTSDEFDAATETAVKSFQASTGYTADGKVGETTYDGLMNESAAILQDDAIPTRTLSYGMRGHDVYILQLRLNDLNYSTTGKMTLILEPNGYFGATTGLALRDFQTNNKITVSGKADSTTRRYLWPTATDNKQIDQVTEQSKNLPTLRKGSYGSYVAMAQMRLKAGGFLVGAADRIFGVNTVKAVMKLQQRYEIKADGVIGPETWAILLAINIENAEQTVVDTDKGSVGNTTKKLQYGNKTKDPDVIKLQLNLQTLGLLDDDPSEADGIFGRRTRTAVRKAQREYNTQFNGSITVDGIVGSDTYSAINELLEIQWKATP